MAVADDNSPLHNADAKDVAAADGRLSLKGDPSKGESYAAMLTRARVPRLEAKADAGPDKEEKKKFSMHAFGAQFCEVRVHEDTGEVRVARWVGAFDIGKRLNEKTATSQIKGGIIFGIGMGLLEQTVADERDARLVNPNLAEYHVPVNADVPEIDVIFVRRPRTRTSTRSASRAWARSGSWAHRRRLPTRCSTPRESACANCRSHRTSCSWFERSGGERARPRYLPNQ